MNSYIKYVVIILLFISFCACNNKTELLDSKEEQRKKVEMVTNYGTMVIELYNETPLHRDNFINLANNNAYDSLLFHRVINKFMIQGGDPDSRKAKSNDTLGEGDAPYGIHAEFNTNLFHKKGVLAAARDNHPEKVSSAMQFYIVQGAILNDSLLERAEKRINQRKAREYYKNDTEKKSLLDTIQYAMDNRNRKRYNVLLDSILSLAYKEESFKVYVIPENQREVYKSIGGTPHLDQNYTVFGEVIEGIDVLDSIANTPTDSRDRPLNDVRIQAVKLVN